MPILFSYFAALQTIISTLTQSMSPSPTDSTSIRPNVSNQLDNMSVGVSLTPTTALRSTTRASPITEVSSQGGFFSSSFSSEVTQTTSTLMSKSIISYNFVCVSQWIPIRRTNQEYNYQKPLHYLKAKQLFRKYQCQTGGRLVLK